MQKWPYSTHPFIWLLHEVFQFYFIVSIVQMISYQPVKQAFCAFFFSVMAFLTILSSIKEAPCQDKYEALLFELPGCSKAG